MRNLLHRLPVRTRTHLLWGTGSVLLLVTIVFTFLHARAIAQVRSVSVPLLQEVPELERRLTLLREQMELAELEAATRVGSRSERVRTYALPEQTDIDRLVATFETVRDTLRSDGLLASMSDVSVGEKHAAGTGATARSLKVSFALREEGVRSIFHLIRLAGLLTVGDALTEAEVRRLIHQTEQENPSGIVELEQFLSTDLLAYGREPRLHVQRLQRSFSSSAFLSTLSDIQRTSLLREARELLSGPLGKALETQHLWPLQFLTVRTVEIERGSAPGWYRLRLELSAHGRAQNA